MASSKDILNVQYAAQSLIKSQFPPQREVAEVTFVGANPRNSAENAVNMTQRHCSWGCSELVNI